MKNKKDKEQFIKILIPEDKKTGVFCNLAQIHIRDDNEREAIFDFAFVEPTTIFK